MDFLCLQETHSITVRAWIKWAEEGKALTAYIFNLELMRGQERLFSTIETLGGLVVCSVTLIARAWVPFYFLVSRWICVSRIFSCHITKRLSDAESALCEGELTLDEC